MELITRTPDKELFLTSQEKMFCKLMAQGQPPEVAAKEVGITSKKQWVELLEKPHIKETLAHLRAHVNQYLGVNITKDLLNGMLLEAHATSATSTEKIAAVRELGKMNGLYAPEKSEITHQAVTKIEQLETLSDEELVQRANMQLTLRNPSEVEDGRYTEE